MPEKSQVENYVRGLLDPLVSFISHMGITPAAITVSGVTISLVGAFFVAGGRLFSGALFLLISGICDIVDGSLARKGQRVTVFGAFLDSTGDRITEIAYFGALIIYYIGKNPFSVFYVFFLVAALAGSFLTSYARARAEGLGIECKVGLLERPERIILLIIGLALGSFFLSAIIVVLAFLTIFTFIQRIVHVKRLTAGKDL